MRPPGEVETLLYRYAHAYDSDDIDGAVACFLPDGLMRVSSRPEPVRGHDELKSFLSAARQARHDAATQPRHLVTNVLVDVAADGASARARAYMSLLLSGFSGLVLDCAGVYEDTLRRTAEGWRFAERFLRFDSAGTPTEVADVAAGGE
jgi:hypothetical protein